MFHRVGNIDAHQGDTLMHPFTIQSAFLQDYHGPYQQKPRIGDGRRTGIADQGHRFAVTNHPHNPVAHAALVVFVDGNQRFANVVVLEQDVGLAGVFTGDNIDRAQNLEGPHGDIA